MRGEVVVVETKNDIEITGLLEEVDFSMNLTLGNVRQVTAQVLCRPLS